MEATAFSNVKRRVIYKTAAGAYIVKTDKGVKYGPKAKYYKNPAGSTVHIKYAPANVVPSPIRPKLVRKVRKNYGEPRGKYTARERGVAVLPVKRAAYLDKLYYGYSPKRPVGRPRKVASWNLPNPMGEGMRKVRKNAGFKRGPRASKKALAQNPFAALM